MDIKNTIFVNQAFASAQRKAESYRHEFIMPEHLLSAILEQEPLSTPCKIPSTIMWSSASHWKTI